VNNAKDTGGPVTEGLSPAAGGSPAPSPRVIVEPGEQMIDIRMLFGRVELEQRYVAVGPEEVECQGRRKDFDGDGQLVGVSEWEPISRCGGLPAGRMLSMLRD
jgi:hypothetical protein